MTEEPDEKLYLDNAASTRPSRQVIEAMLEVMRVDYGNPSSRHAMGLAAERRLRRARSQVARRLGLSANRVVFTSGGSESLALALLGSGTRQRSPGHLLISAIEHPAVLRTARRLEREGHSVEEVPVGATGRVEAEQVAARVRDDTFLVALMHVNNESGVVQPVAEVSAAVKARKPGCRLLVDIVQSFGLLDTRLEQLGADMVALSGHKLHGPKGVGALGLARDVKLKPLWEGGRQESGLRAGTENVPGIVGLGVAAECGKGDADSLGALTALVARTVTEQLPRAEVLGDARHRAPHILALAIPGVRADVLVNALGASGVYVSSGAACHSRGAKRSHVLQAMRVPEDHGVVRISVSRELTPQQCEQAAQRLVETVRGLGQ
jgi:cysteine desulfurase